MKQIKNNFSYLFLFIISFILLISMVLLKPSPIDTIRLVDRLYIAIVFITSCLFGISISIYPNWWKSFFRNKHDKSDIISNKKSTNFKGHHPNCKNFKSHIIIVMNKTRCAGCLGLIFGSMISIFLMILFLFIIPVQPINLLYFLFILGLFIILFIYLEIKLQKRRVIIHIFSNIFFIISFFSLTYSVFEITGKVIFGILTTIICFFWLDIRIQLSKQQHSIICASCSETCKAF